MLLFDPNIMSARLFGFMMVLFLFHSCQNETQRRDDYDIQGIDVSRYQARVNWESVAQQQMHFAFVKATEGATHTDSLFQHNWEGIKMAGIRRGAYHFYRPRTSAVDQADHFVSRVQLATGDLPPVLDIEVLDGVSPKQLVPALKTWLVLISRHYGVRPIIYTNLNFYNKNLAGHFDDYPLWIARYKGGAPVLACGRDWQFWQYGDNGQLEGIDGPVDFNVFAGDWLDLDRLSYKEDTVLSHQESLKK